MNWYILLNLSIIFTILTSFSILDQPNISFSDNDAKYQESILKFNDWAENHNISLKGINKSSDYLLRHGFNQYNDMISINTIPDILIVAETFYKIPDPILKSMDGKTIYFSTEKGRGLVLSSYYSKPIANMDDGIIIEQQITSYYILHELGHIFDFNDSQIQYQDEINKVKNEIFSIDNLLHTNFDEIPKGYLSYYSLTNKEENYADHFAYYAFNGEKFREMAVTDSLLGKKYNFFRDNVFDGLEY